MASIYDPIPNNPFFYPQTNYLSTPLGNVVAGTGISINQFGVATVTSALGGTVRSVVAGDGLSGGTITDIGTISLAKATNVSLGGIKVGANLMISPDGTLSALPPGVGTVNSVTVGPGLSGGGSGPNVYVNLDAASKTSYGGVIIGDGIDVVGALISLAQASTTAIGGVHLATNAEVIAGTNSSKAITPTGLAAKVASTSARGIVQLSDSVATNDSTKAATQTAAKLAYDSALAAQATANAALPKAGGTMTGLIVFAPGQTFPGVALPKATTSSLGVVQIGSGLNISPGGILSTAKNGTVTSVVAGPGLGAPVTGNPITTTGTIRLLPPTGTSLGGVKQGANISIGVDGTISADGLLKTNNPYAFNSYIWPIPDGFGMAPGTDGQVFTLLDHVTGEVGWTSTGTLQSVVGGPGVNVVSTATTATVSLAPVPSITAGNIGGTALIPTLAINQYGQITSMGLANPFAAFQTPSITAPFILVMDFAGNNTNWKWILNGNTTIQNPLNAQPGQTGSLLITQDPFATYSITWGDSWKFGNFSPFFGAGLGEVTMLKFTVVATNYIVVDTIVPNIG